jgi:hypothetical protein
LDVSDFTPSPILDNNPSILCLMAFFQLPFFFGERGTMGSESKIAILACILSQNNHRSLNQLQSNSPILYSINTFTREETNEAYKVLGRTGTLLGEGNNV